MWQTEFDNLQKEEHSLCELLVIRSLIDLTEYDDENDDWKGFVTNKDDQFKVGLDFIAAKLGFYAWRQIFYSEKFEPVFKEDIAIFEILHDFVNNKRKRIKIPKSTDFFSQSNERLRQKIIKNCLTVDMLEKTKTKCGIFEISTDGEFLIVEIKVIDSFEPIRHIGLIISKHFPDPLPSFTSIYQKSIQNLSKAIFDKIRKIQNNGCFYCPEKIQTQDHFIPKTFLHETNPSNIIGACKKCNRDKWFEKPLDEKHFDRILKRNKEHVRLMEVDYFEKEYIKKYERFKKIIE